MRNILITGGAGFIGSHLVRHFVNTYPNYNVICLDALTYAGNPENLMDLKDKENFTFVKADIRNINDTFIRNDNSPYYSLDKIEYGLKSIFEKYKITDVIHLAAESHVDRSITNPMDFVNTNVIGTVNLLNMCKEYWKDDYSTHRFHHVSTDEVYGTLSMDNLDEKFKETTPYSPHSPYSSSKASSDHFVKAYHDTYGINVTISNCSNNYGPNQFPEKLIPLSINKLSKGQKIPIYGTGENVRDWLYVEDHVKAIDCIFHNGKNGETYNVGGNNEMSNIDIVKKIIEVFEYETEGVSNIDFNNFIKYVEDRKGHDLRYAIDASKIETELGWHPEETFDTGIEKTVKWYINNKEWINHIEYNTYQDQTL